MIQVVSFRGKAKHGKSSSAKFLLEAHGDKAVRLAFASPLKLEVFDALWSGVFPATTPGYIWDIMENHRPDEKFRPLARYYISDDDAIDYIDQHKDSGEYPLRSVLQWWGTEYRRGESPTYWIDRAKEMIDKALADGKLVVMDDCRFDNEHEFLRNNYSLLDVLVDNVEAKEPFVPEHASEAGIKAHPNVVIANRPSRGHDWLK
ncbi:MAG: hypothetical protein WAN50_05455, partial [Minisyncoccia bacterium]